MPIKIRIFFFCCLFSVANACHQSKVDTQAKEASPSRGAVTAPSATTSNSDSSTAESEQDGKGKTEAADNTSGPCALLTSEEIQSVQGTPLKAKNVSVASMQGYRTTQCLYQTEDINRSVSVSITEADPDDPQKYSVMALWKKMFAKKPNSDKEREREGEARQRAPGADEEDEDEKEAAPAKRLKGLGNDAYWVAAKFGGALYVLKGERFIRISIGGRDDLPTKLRSSTTLARMALSRF